MDITEYRKIKNGNSRQQEILYEMHQKTVWFICYHTTLSVETAVPLLQNAWKETISSIGKMTTPPQESFLQLLCEKILSLSGKTLSKDDSFCNVPAPKIYRKYEPFLEQLDKLPIEQRVLYLVHHFGGLSVPQIANVRKKSADEMKEQLQEISTAVLHISQRYHISGTEVITLSAQFRKSDRSALASLVVPDMVADALRHDAQKQFSTQTGKQKPTKRKDTNMKTKRKNKAKIIGWCIAGALILAAVILLLIFLPKIKQASAAADITTTYTAEAITYGDVDSTISSGGTLTPLTTEMVTMPAGTEETTTTNAAPSGMNQSEQTVAVASSDVSEVVSVAVVAGDTVAAGDVIAVVKNEDDEESNVTAGIDGVVLEVPASAGDSISAGSEIAMLMGQDGFSLSLSVDELDISQVEIGQEVTITLDALTDTYTGTVSAVSYNGTSSGSTTTYQITATMDYVEGIYPAMNATAEIVTESSGEGLLVPVEAVRTSGDESYVYLAPDGAESGTEYEEEEIDTDDLTKVTVESGMSDGSYIMIESDTLSEGDLILITTMTSSATGSENSDVSEERGGFGGGGFPSGEAGGDFDPSNMPQGGGGMQMGKGE